MSTDSTDRKGSPASSAPFRACPSCGKAASARYKPFCSKACADDDLARWLKGSYRIPAEPPGQRMDDEEDQ